METKNTDTGFKYTYSAKEQEEIKKIRQKYTVQEEDGITRLKKLDAHATGKATGMALILGVVMDSAVGGAGLYTSTLLPIAVMRRWILFLTTRRSVEAGDQTSLLSRMPLRQVMIYVGAMLLLYNAMFFSLESLSTVQTMQLIATILCSTILSIILAWPIVRLFLKRVTR